VADDQVTAALEEIRHRRNVAARMPVLSGRQARVLNRDVPVLLAAIEGVLKLAGEWNEAAASLDAMADRADARGADPLRTTLMSARAQARHDLAAAVRETISSALLGPQTAPAGEGR
jgi:hypothetical protein